MYLAHAINTSPDTFPGIISESLVTLSLVSGSPNISIYMGFEYSQKLGIHPDCSQSMIART
jgi:hypothetical protein